MCGLRTRCTEPVTPAPQRVVRFFPSVRLHKQQPTISEQRVGIPVAVEPDAENRTLRIEADGTDMFRASEVALNGVNEKRLHAFTFKNLSAGHYTLRAHVMSASEVRGMATNEMTVTGAGLR